MSHLCSKWTRLGVLCRYFLYYKSVCVNPNTGPLVIIVNFFFLYIVHDSGDLVKNTQSVSRFTKGTVNRVN